MDATNSPPGTLAICTTAGERRVVRIEEPEDASDDVCTVFFVDGTSKPVPFATLGELTRDALTSVLRPDEAESARTVLATVAVASFAQYRTTPSVSAATVGLRALNSAALPLAKFAQLVSEFGLPTAAAGDNALASQLACTIAETLVQKSSVPGAVAESLACIAWCSEMFHRSDEKVPTDAAEYIVATQDTSE